MLSEVRLRTDITKKAAGFGNKKFLNKPIEKIQQDFNKTSNRKLKHHSTMEDGRHVYAGIDSDGHHHFMTTNHEGKVDTSMTAMKIGKSHKVDMAVATPGAGIHKLYHHLITKHNHILTSDEQSPGGLAIWKKMRKMGGVNIHGYHKKTGKGENVDIIKHPEETHVTNKELRSLSKTKGGTISQRKAEQTHLKKQKDLMLVAHKNKNIRPMKEGTTSVIKRVIRESFL